MPRIIPNLWFDTEALEAAEYYCSIFPNSEITNVTHYTEAGPGEPGTVLTVDFTTSNVRAAPFDLYIAGALMTHNHPLGPVAGTAWNLTTMSYRGALNIGLHSDRAAVDAPGELADDIAAAFDELLAAGGSSARAVGR